jgi:periplasmic protein CpxP/Spy
MKKLMIVTLTLFSAAAFAGSPMEKGADRHVQKMTQELNLNEEQQQEVREIYREKGEEMRELHKETQEEIRDVLNDEQRAQYDQHQKDRMEKWEEKKEKWKERHGNN